jgi:hypothetical protein
MVALFLYGSAQRASPLLLEDLFDVADLFLNLATDLLRSATILEIGVPDDFAGLLFYRALGLIDFAFDFIFRARVHASDSQIGRGEVVPRELMQLRK